MSSKRVAEPVVTDMDTRMVVKDDYDLPPSPNGTKQWKILFVVIFVVFAVTTSTLGVAIANLMRLEAEKEDMKAAPLPGFLWQDGVKPKLTVALFTNYPPYATWNTTIGQPDQLSGIGYDFLLEACDVCGLDCEVVVDKWSNCWTDDLPGVGLQAGYYHACATYTNQYQRQWSLEFSDGILGTNKPAGILSRLVNGLPKISPTSDLSGLKICDVAGWAPTIKSLYYSQNDCTDHSLFQGFEVVTPAEDGPDAAMKMLLAGECDGIYMYADMIAVHQECNGCSFDPSLYKHLGTEYAWVHTGVVEHMANGTTLTMSKKGSGVPELINPCIQKVIRSKAYVEMCAKHGLLSECYKNEYTPSTVDTPYYFLNNNERDESCATDDTTPHCGCANGYCPCSSPSTDAPAADYSSGGG